MYFSPERAFIGKPKQSLYPPSPHSWHTKISSENSIFYSQESVSGSVRPMCYKDGVQISGRSSEASNLYSQKDASMDSLEGFSPTGTTDFIAINAIRPEKCGLRMIKNDTPPSKPSA